MTDRSVVAAKRFTAGAQYRAKSDASICWSSIATSRESNSTISTSGPSMRFRPAASLVTVKKP